MQSMADFTNMTERLALMPDPALQQFAQMHRDDPFTLALAVSESNRRKKMRTAQQGLAGMQQQPPVADQEIAQMNAPAMPENVGIGALPAPVLAAMPAGGIAGEEEIEPQTMAGGGLVAFADGGSTFTTADAVRRARLEAEARARVNAGLLPAAPYEAPGFFPAGSVLGMLQRGQGVQFPEGSLLGSIQSSALTDPIVQQQIAQEQAARETASRSTPPAATPAATSAATTGTPGLPAGSYTRRTGAPAPADRPIAPASAGRPATPGAGATVPGGGLGDLATLYNRTLSAQNYTDPAEARLKALEAKELAATTEEKAALERDQARFAEAFKGREARLGKREAEIGKQKDTNLGLSFLNAGLAIMSTPGGLATAIGKGARVGTEQFASGLEKIRSAQEKLDEARDRMEELKLNRDEMSAKEIRAAENKIRQVGIDAEKRGIDGLRQAGQINREMAKTIFDKTVQVGITREEIAGRERAARISASAPPANMQMAAALGGGTSPAQLAVGLQKMAEATTGKTDMRTLYSNYLAGAQKNPGVDVLSYAQFIGQFAIPTSPGNNPAAAPGTVRER
jgi:hypothetical protein